MITPHKYDERLQEIALLNIPIIDPPETEGVFRVYLNERIIDVPPNLENIGVQYETNAEHIWFLLDRYFDGMDLWNSIQSKKLIACVQYESASFSNLIAIEGMALNPKDSEESSFLLGIPVISELTAAAGSVDISLRIYAYNNEDRKYTYQLITQPATVNILEGHFITANQPTSLIPASRLEELVGMLSKLTDEEGGFVEIAESINQLNSIVGSHENEINALEAILYGADKIQNTSDDLSAIVKDNLQKIGNLTDNTYNKSEIDDKIANITIDVDDTLEGNEESENPIATKVVSDINDRLQELESQFGNLTFTPVKIQSFSAEPAYIEKAAGIVKKVIQLFWKLNKGSGAVLTLKGLNEDIDLDIAESGSYSTSELDIDKDIVFTLSAVDNLGGTSDEATAAVKLVNGIYYGVAEKIEDYSSIVNQLTKNLQESKNITFTVAPNVTQYIYFALPASYGAPEFSVGGFSGGFELDIENYNLTNTSGYTEAYNIWRSTNLNLGNTTVIVS